jgi:penicillin-binding protein 1A
MVMDPFSAQIKAWVGGINYRFFQFDHVMQAKRQPGSTFKPILYAAAIEKGMSPCDSLQDRPVTINYVENGEKKSWSPHNADYVFSGVKMTLRRAMAKSVNSIAAQVTELIGWNTVIEYARKLGITSPLASVPSIGLGSSDVSVYELAGAYSTFLNHGVWSKPQFLLKICDRQGRVITVFNPTRRRAISDTTAFLMVDMLKAGTEEPGATTQALFSFDIFRNGRGYNELGGKTGTSSNHSDGWFVGVSKDLVGATWVGGEDRSIHFRTSALGEGAKTALPIFGLFMEKVYADNSLGITKGAFPKPGFKINKRYGCRTRLPVRDTTFTTVPDSLSPAEIPDEGI